MGLMDLMSIFGCPTRKTPPLSPARGKDFPMQTGKDFKEVRQYDQTRPSPPKRTVKNFENAKMRSTADVFQPDELIVDPTEPQWAQFLAAKAFETRPKEAAALGLSRSKMQSENAAKAKAKVAPPSGNFTLQTSEYLKLLKSGDDKPSKGKQMQRGPPGLEGNDLLSCDALKADLTGALDSIIRSHWAGQIDPTKKKKKAMPSNNKKDDAVWRIAQMIDSKDEGDAQDDAGQKATACDDIAVEIQNRDEDLAELAYWSDDDQAPRAIHRASAHKIGDRQLDNRKIREYVTQKVGQDLDKQVATLLLHLRRLNDRHRSFELDSLPRRNFVVGIKEVFRAVRNKNVKCIVVAPDIEDASVGGLDDRLRDLLKVSFEQDLPVVFSLSRVRMGRALGKSLRMSVIAVLDVKGCQGLFENAIELAYQNRLSWLAEQPAPPPVVQKVPAVAQQSPGAERTKGKGKGKGKNQYNQYQY